MPRDWALRPSYDTRVAIINAMYACGENVQKLMPVLLTEAIRRDRCAPPLQLTWAEALHAHACRAAHILLTRRQRSYVAGLCAVLLVRQDLAASK